MRSTIILLTRKKLVLPVISTIILFIFATTLVFASVFTDRSVLEGKTIILDPGHGGVDSGTNNSQIKEKDVNLDVALKLRKKLSDNGAKVIMTRTEDVEMYNSGHWDRIRYISDLNERIKIINNSSGDIFISIHTNVNVNKPSTRGAIAFYYSSHAHNRDMAYIFQNVFNSLAFNLNGKEIKSHHIPQKGNYYVLKNAKIPGIIVETGFISNSTDLMLLKKVEYREYLSESIYQGIIDYFLCCDKLPQKVDDTIYIEEENIIDMAEEDKV